MTTIITKKGSGEPALDSLQEAELAVDITNGDLYTKASGQIVKLNGEGGTGNGNPVVISDDPPEEPEEGDLWYCSKADQEGLYCWDGAVWFGTESPNSVGLEEAPEDSKQYARRNASWSEVVIPAAPVDSVNGKTGTVVLSAADVGALPNSYDPGINYPVTSVNGKTGAVNLTHTDVGAQVAGSYATETYVNNAVAAHSVDGGVY